MERDWPYELPGMNWSDEEEELAVLDVLRKGSLFRYYGPGQPRHTAELEARAQEFYGTKHALAVSSGTGALTTSVLVLGIGPGCEVIVPAFMWVATVGAVVQANAIPVLCEINGSFSMDPEDLEQKITPRTKLIIPVHMAGAPCDMSRIMEVADEHGVPVLEDCSQCNGGEFEGRKVGTFGAVGVFSFQINKNATAGEGGLIVTDSDDLHLRALAAHDLGVPWKDGAPHGDSSMSIWGQGRRMSELCGAVANVQLGKLPSIIDHMRRSKERIKAMLEGIPDVAFRRLNDPKGDTGPFLVMILDDEARAGRVAENIAKTGLASATRVADYSLHIYYNIRSLVDKIPLSAAGNPWMLKENADSVYEYAKGTCPKSDALFARSVLLPIPSRLSEEQEKALAETIKAALAA